MRRYWLGLMVVFMAWAALRVAAATTTTEQVAPPASAAAAALEQLPGIPERPHPGGYDRSCKAGDGCVFGTAWTDDVDVTDGHNGCSTRDDVLRRDLTAAETKTGTRGCVVVAGALHDPYTGQILQFAKARAGDVNIDHILPLAAAWDLGAWRWTPRQRQNFANDPLNLLAVQATVNLSKGDRTPGEWTPSTASGRCLYAERYVAVAVAYRLPVTPADRAALAVDLHPCT